MKKLELFEVIDRLGVRHKVSATRYKIDALGKVTFIEADNCEQHVVAEFNFNNIIGIETKSVYRDESSN